MSTTRAQYYLITKNTSLANTYGLACGDVLMVPERGESVILRHVAYGPKLAVRVRLAQEAGTLVPLEPARAEG